VSDIVEVGTRPGRNGGTLRAGGKPGNKGGGRPKDAVLSALRDDLETGLARLRKALASGDLSRDEELKYAALALRYTTPVPKERAGYDRELVDNLSSAVAEELATHQDSQEILEGIKNRWIPILAKAIRDG